MAKSVITNSKNGYHVKNLLEIGDLNNNNYQIFKKDVENWQNDLNNVPTGWTQYGSQSSKIVSSFNDHQYPFEINDASGSDNGGIFKSIKISIGDYIAFWINATDKSNTFFIQLYNSPTTYLLLRIDGDYWKHGTGPTNIQPALDDNIWEKCIIHFTSSSTYTLFLNENEIGIFPMTNAITDGNNYNLYFNSSTPGNLIGYIDAFYHGKDFSQARSVFYKGALKTQSNTDGAVFHNFFNDRLAHINGTLRIGDGGGIDYKKGKFGVEQWGTSGTPTNFSALNSPESGSGVLNSYDNHLYPVKTISSTAVWRGYYKTISNTPKFYGFSFQTNGNGYGGVLLGNNPSTPSHQLALVITSGKFYWHNGSSWIATQYSAVSNQWYHIVIFYDPITGNYVFWINGGQILSGTSATSTLSYIALASYNNTAYFDSLYIGNYPSNAFCTSKTAVQEFLGQMDGAICPSGILGKFYGISYDGWWPIWGGTCNGTRQTVNIASRVPKGASAAMFWCRTNGTIGFAVYNQDQVYAEITNHTTSTSTACPPVIIPLVWVGDACYYQYWQASGACYHQLAGYFL